MNGWRVQLARFDVPLALLDELRRLGYETPSARDLISAGIFKVDVAYLRASGCGRLSPGKCPCADPAADLTGSKCGLYPGHESSQPSPAAVAQRSWWSCGSTGRRRNGSPAGRNSATIFPLGEIVNTRIHGASPDYARAMMAEVRDRPTVQQFINMRIHGVRPAAR